MASTLNGEGSIHCAGKRAGDSIDHTQLCRRLSLPHTLQIVVLATDKTVNSPRNGRSSFSRSGGRRGGDVESRQLTGTFVSDREGFPLIKELSRALLKYSPQHHKHLTPVASIYHEKHKKKKDIRRPSLSFTSSWVK